MQKSREIILLGVDYIAIEQPTDICKSLCLIQSTMLERQKSQKGYVNFEKWQKAINYLSILIDQAKKDGFGNYEGSEIREITQNFQLIEQVKLIKQQRQDEIEKGLN